MAAPPSINDARKGGDRPDTAFRSAMTSQEGNTPGKIVDGKIVNINLVNWTVDVASTYDRHKYLNIQMGSPYLHFNNGEGIYVMPDVGAKCAVCLPSDSSPPFLLSFLMPVEKVQDASAPDAPQGTNAAHGSVMKNATAARFDGGRPKAKPGDIFIRGRDGNFITLHRGGVLQIGASELSQRIFIPLDNHMLDISERYSHHNVGGSHLWGIAEGQQQQAVANTETYRIFAEDKYADIRITKGFVTSPIAPEGPLAGRVVYEVAIGTKAFDADSGNVGDSGAPIVYQFAVDRLGNISTTVSGDVFCHLKKKLTLNVDSDFQFQGKAGGNIIFSSGLSISGGDYLTLTGKMVRLGAGTQPVARKGDAVSTKAINPVQAILTLGITPLPPGFPAAIPCKIAFIESLGGVIISGNDAVRA